MKDKWIDVAILAAVLVAANLLLHHLVVPEQSTDLALQQMNEDGSREKLRLLETLSNWITPALVVAGAVGCWRIFSRR